MLLFFCVNAASAPKTDKVTLENGDVITGELKSLERGMLRVGTDSMGTLDIEWEEVVAVTSDQDLLVETVDGTRYFGSLVASDDPTLIKVRVADADDEDAELHEVIKSEVVLITPIEKKFGAKLKVNLNLGYSFTKSSDVGQLSFAGDMRYRTQKYRLRLDLTSITTTQTNEPTTRTQELVLDYRYFLKNRWFALGVGGLNRSTELGIDLRAFAGGGAGRKLIQTNRTELVLSGGLTGVHEEPTGGGTTDNIESFFNLEYRLFVFKQPKRDVLIRFALIPSVTDAGRLRTNLDTRFRLELVKDFFWEMRFFAVTDSDPPAGAVSDSDYGVITSLGYSL